MPRGMAIKDANAGEAQQVPGVDRPPPAPCFRSTLTACHSGAALGLAYEKEKHDARFQKDLFC
jgi:hypothetical protein